jgi:hypothetical protein
MVELALRQDPGRPPNPVDVRRARETIGVSANRVQVQQGQHFCERASTAAFMLAALARPDTANRSAVPGRMHFLANGGRFGEQERSSNRTRHEHAA